MSKMSQQREVERKNLQITEAGYDSKIQQKKIELLGLDDKINKLQREKDIISSDSEYRVMLIYRKRDLEARKKQHSEM